jgi:ferric-dicitrate binding protein FerR (iron transport regulator)
MTPTPRDELRDELEAFLADTAPDRAARAALKARVLADRPSRTRRAVLAVSLAAAAVLAAFIATRPDGARPTGPVALGSDPAPVAVQQDVVVRAQGVGVATPGRVAWSEGTVRVEVTPDRGVSFEVTTDEAVVRVVGTVFEVERGLYGTAVAVDRGTVEVTCRGGRPAQVSAGGGARCFPSAETGAGYVVELQRRGAPAEDWLDAVAAARRAPATLPDTAAVLLALEVDALLVATRRDEAVAKVEAALAGGDEVLDRTLSAVVAARLADGCAGAEVLLRALAGRGDADAAAWLARCAP